MINAMKYNSDSIVAEILNAVNRIPGTEHSDFYVGITNNIERRLSEHKITKKDCLRILEATNRGEAEMAEIVLIHSGFEGHQGGGTDDTNFMYCYQITDKTEQ